MKKFVPHEYQQLGIEFLIKNPRAALWAQPGLGKTVMALTAIDMLRLINFNTRTLVVVPKRVLDTEGWSREIKKWNHLRDLAIEPITGDAAQRRWALMSPKPIHIINFELLPWLLTELVRCWPYDHVIIDESSKLKSHDGTWFMGNPATKTDVRYGSTLRLFDGRQLKVDDTTPVKMPGSTMVVKSKASDSRFKRIEFTPTPGLKHVAPMTERWTNLTGTPMPNGAGDLWSQTYLMDQGQRLGINITRFREYYMQPHPYVKHKWVPQHDALDRVIPLIQDICMSIKAKDWLPIEDPVTHRYEFALPPDLLAQYRHLEDEFFIALEKEGGQIVEASNSAVLMNKLLQFTSGAMYTNKERTKWSEVHTRRIETLREFSDDYNAPVLVAYHFKFEEERLLKNFKDAVLFDGSRKQIDDFCKGKFQHLLMHPQSGGHGVDGLQDGTDTIYFYNNTWSSEEHDQIIERIGPTRQLQSGHPRPVFCHYSVIPDTVDEMQIERVVQKKSMQEILMNATKRRKERHV